MNWFFDHPVEVCAAVSVLAIAVGCAAACWDGTFARRAVRQRAGRRGGSIL